MNILRVVTRKRGLVTWDVFVRLPGEPLSTARLYGVITRFAANSWTFRLCGRDDWTARRNTKNLLLGAIQQRLLDGLFR